MIWRGKETPPHSVCTIVFEISIKNYTPSRSFYPVQVNEPQISTVYPFFILKSTVKQNNATNASYMEACLLIQKDYFLPTILSMI